MINYLDLLLYRPTKKDKCERCEEFKNNILTKTEQDKKENAIHIFQGNHMKNRMGESEATCASPTLGKKHKKTKQGKAPQKECDDLIAHIATDMQQIQNVPKLQVGCAYYKSKVNLITIRVKHINSE